MKYAKKYYCAPEGSHVEVLMNGSIPTDQGDMTIALWTPESKLYTENEYLKLIQ